LKRKRTQKYAETKKEISRSSPEALVILRLRLTKNSRVSLPMELRDSTATGWKILLLLLF